MAKMKLNQRLELEIFERLMQLQASQKISMDDLIANSLDALEREIKMGASPFGFGRFSRQRVGRLRGKITPRCDRGAFFATPSAGDFPRNAPG